MDSLHVAFTGCSEPSLIWTIIVSISAAANVCVAILMWLTTHRYTKITEDMFFASQRPYIGTITYIHNLHTDSSKVRLTVKLQNYGNIPAKKVDALIQVIIDNKILPVENSEATNQIFFPHWIHTLDVMLNDKDLFLAIKNGKSVLELRTFIKYYGITDKEYSTNEVSVYNHTAKLFIKKTGEWA